MNSLLGYCSHCIARCTLVYILASVTGKALKTTDKCVASCKIASLIEMDQLYATNFRCDNVNNKLVITSYYTIYSLGRETVRYDLTPCALGKAISRTPEPRVILNFSKLSLAKPTSLIVDIPPRGTGCWNAYQWMWRNVTQFSKLCVRHKLNVGAMCCTRCNVKPAIVTNIASSPFDRLAEG